MNFIYILGSKAERLEEVKRGGGLTQEKPCQPSGVKLQAPGFGVFEKSFVLRTPEHAETETKLESRDLLESIPSFRGQKPCSTGSMNFPTCLLQW